MEVTRRKWEPRRSTIHRHRWASRRENALRVRFSPIRNSFWTRRTSKRWNSGLGKGFFLEGVSLTVKSLLGSNLGYHATHAVVYAQLYTNNICYGLHIFVVPIRYEGKSLVLFSRSSLFSDPVSYKTFDGVQAGDIGAKCGWNGLDNGWGDEGLIGTIWCPSPSQIRQLCQLSHSKRESLE